LDKCTELFSLPKHVIPVVLVVIGYPASKPGIRKKFTPDVMVHNEKYQDYDPSELYEKYVERETKSQTAFTDKQLDTFEANYQAVYGKDKADEIVAKIKERNWLSPIQFVFGLHYHAALMPLQNMRFIESLLKQDLHFFEEWKPLDESALNYFEFEDE
jgi:hypothetical protein